MTFNVVRKLYFISNDNGLDSLNSCVGLDLARKDLVLDLNHRSWKERC